MTQEEYHRVALAQQQATLELMRAQDRATAERIRAARGQAAGFAAFTGTAYYPFGMGTPYDIDKRENPPMKQANARVIEKPQLPEK